VVGYKPWEIWIIVPTNGKNTFLGHVRETIELHGVFRYSFAPGKTKPRKTMKATEKIV
jgi:hypothetical protein